MMTFLLYVVSILLRHILLVSYALGLYVACVQFEVNCFTRMRKLFFIKAMPPSFSECRRWSCQDPLQWDFDVSRASLR